MPFCVTVEPEPEAATGGGDGDTQAAAAAWQRRTVTVRMRDNMLQTRVSVAELLPFLEQQMQAGDSYSGGGVADYHHHGEDQC